MPRRLRLRPAPGPEDLTSRTVHEVVRDYPETLAALRRAGVDPAAEGGRPLGHIEGGSRIVAAVLAATAWRPHPSATPSTGKMGGADAP